MAYQDILIDQLDAVAIITLNHPERVNLMGGTRVEDTIDALASFHTNHDIRAVILTGAGGHAFGVGADV